MRQVTRAACLVLVSLLVRRSNARAQLPRLDPLVVAPAAAVLDFYPGYPPVLVMHPSGCLATFDMDDAQVVCIDRKSGTMRRVGRKGSGPGEFRSVRTMIAMPGGGVAAYDVANSRITEIGPDWTIGRMTPMTSGFGWLLSATADSVVVNPGSPDNQLTAISLRDGGMAGRFHLIDSAHAGFFAAVPPVYPAGALWSAADHAGGWIVVAPFTYRVLIEDRRGSVTNVFGRDLPPEMPAAADLDRMKRMMPGAGPNMLARLAHIPEPEVIGAPIEDSRGRIWTLTSRVRQDSTEVDVFDPRGTFLGTRRVPGEALAMALRTDELCFIRQYLQGDNEGADGFLCYRIR